MALTKLSNDLPGQKYKVIIPSITSINTGSYLDIDFDFIAYSIGREKSRFSLSVAIPYETDLSGIKEMIIDAVIDYCKDLGFPLDRVDILCFF